VLLIGNGDSCSFGVIFLVRVKIQKPDGKEQLGGLHLNLPLAMLFGFGQHLGNFSGHRIMERPLQDGLNFGF
jgi:hypothetical protein